MCVEIFENKDSDKVVHPFMLRLWLSQEKQRESDLVFAYSQLLDLVVVTGKKEILQSLKDGEEDGEKSPSLVTAYKAGVDVVEELKKLGEFKPYKWAQNLCGIRVVLSIADYEKKPFTIEEMKKKLSL